MIVIIISPLMGIALAARAPLNVWLLQPVPARSPGAELGRAQRARRGHQRDRRAGARHPRREGVRPRGQGARPRRRRHRARVPFSMTRARLLAGLRHLPEDVAVARPGRVCSRSARGPAGHRPPQRSGRSCSRSRSAPGFNQFASAFGRHRQRVAVPPQRAGPPRRDAGAQRAAGHRRPHDPAALHRARAPWRRRHLRRPALPARPRRARAPGRARRRERPARLAARRTLAGIASGLIDAGRGRGASLDGIALADLDPAQLRQTIRVVSEEPLLLAATLRDNLLLGACGEIDDDSDARRACAPPAPTRSSTS